LAAGESRVAKSDSGRQRRSAKGDAERRGRKGIAMSGGRDLQNGPSCLEPRRGKVAPFRMLKGRAWEKALLEMENEKMIKEKKANASAQGVREIT